MKKERKKERKKTEKKKRKGKRKEDRKAEKTLFIMSKQQKADIRLEWTHARASVCVCVCPPIHSTAQARVLVCDHVCVRTHAFINSHALTLPVPPTPQVLRAGERKSGDGAENCEFSSFISGVGLRMHTIIIYVQTEADTDVD